MLKKILSILTGLFLILIMAAPVHSFINSPNDSGLEVSFMAYSTKSDLEARIGHKKLLQLADPHNVGSIDDTTVTAAITDADAKIDSYLANRGYSVPLSTVPDLIKGFSIDIALWNLRSAKPGKDESIEKRYKAAMDMLVAISTNKASLGIDTEPTGGEQQIKSSHEESDRVFTMGKASDSSVGSLDNY